MSELNLNLGSGKSKVEGYLNLDIRNLKEVDIVHDLNKPLPYKDEEVDNIFTSHVIEHFWWQDSIKMLKDWYRVLKPGGKLEIWTVDLDKVIYKMLTNADNPVMMYDANWRIFGKKEPEGQAHHSIFTRRYLNLLLTNVGFKKVGYVDPERYAFKPLHNGINLGMIAIK